MYVYNMHTYIATHNYLENGIHNIALKNYGVLKIH